MFHDFKEMKPYISLWSIQHIRADIRDKFYFHLQFHELQNLFSEIMKGDKNSIQGPFNGYLEKIPDMQLKANALDLEKVKQKHTGLEEYDT